MLTEVRGRDGERVEIVVAAGDVDGVADRDGVAVRGLFHEEEFHALARGRRWELGARFADGRQGGEPGHVRVGKGFRVAAGDTQDQALACEVLRIEAFHVVEGDGREPGDRAGRGVTVGVSAVKHGC